MARPTKRETEGAREAELREIVEAVGLWFEAGGLPRMAGRVVGWLLVCDPPEQTMPELAENLSASMASISTMTRALTQFGLIERTSWPGERRNRYRIRSDAWSWTIEERLRRIHAFLGVVDKALGALRDAPPPRRERLETITKSVRTYEAALSELVTDWRNGTPSGAPRPTTKATASARKPAAKKRATPKSR